MPLVIFARVTLSMEAGFAVLGIYRHDYAGRPSPVAVAMRPFFAQHADISRDARERGSLDGTRRQPCAAQH